MRNYKEPVSDAKESVSDTPTLEELNDWIEENWRRRHAYAWNYGNGMYDDDDDDDDDVGNVGRRGICSNCNKENTGYKWCKECYSGLFQQSFSNWINKNKFIEKFIQKIQTNIQRQWTSKNKFIDKFIQNTQINAQNKRQLLEWIPYNKFENIKYFDKGGFSIIYKAIWTDGFIISYDYEKKKWIRKGSINVILKSLDKSSKLNEEFLNEWKHHYNCYSQLKKYSNKNLIQLYGFTQDPNTLNYMVIMEYATKNNLRKNLSNIVKDRWIIKLLQLNNIISGLEEIHQKNLIHCDFHHGNILNIRSKILSISDLGLCKPVDYFQRSKKK